MGASCVYTTVWVSWNGVGASQSVPHRNYQEAPVFKASPQAGTVGIVHGLY
jgi:hypothetical protein